MATFTTSLKSWKAGQNSQIKSIRLAVANDGALGIELASDMSQLLGTSAHGWNKTHVRSWNAAMQRECKRANKASKLDDAPVYGLSLNDDKDAVVFGLAKVSSGAVKCEFASVVAKFRASGAFTDANKKIAITLLNGMLKESSE